MSALPIMPFDPAWLEQSQAFFHDDPRLAKARMQLLMACFRGSPAATIPKSIRYVMQTTGLAEDQVREHWALLTEGMSTSPEGRLVHDGMRSIWDALSSRYSKALEEFAAASVMAQQDPEQFALVAVESAKPKARGKTGLPKGFGFQMYPELIGYAHSIGCITDEDKAWIMQSYVDYIESRDERAKSWPAHFRTWARRQIEQFRAVPPSRQARPGTSVAVGARASFPAAAHRKEASAEHNLAMLVGAGGGGGVGASRQPQGEVIDVQVTPGRTNGPGERIDPLAAMMSRTAERPARAPHVG